MFGGSRNSRALRLTVAGGLALLTLYLMYTWRSEALEKASHLSKTEMEYQALQTRFDKLNQELKSAVKRQSQLDEEIKDQRLSYVQLEKEKDSLQTECSKEAQALKKEKRNLEEIKATLIEQKDLAESERDQSNAKLQQMTVELNELREAGEQKYAALEVSCDEAANTCNGKLSAKVRELESTQTDLADISHRLNDCTGQLPVLRDSVESCHRQLESQESNGRNRAEEVKQLQDQLRRQQNQNDQISRELQNAQRGGPPKLSDDLRLKRQASDQDQFDLFRNPIPKSTNVRGGMVDRENWRLSDSIHGNQGGGEQAAGAQNSEDIKIPEEEKRRIFNTIQARVINGEELDDRQKQIYRLLYKFYGTKSSDQQFQKPNVVDHVPPAAPGAVRAPQENGRFDQGQVPPAQHVFMREQGGNINAEKKPSQDAEHEEVKDLVEGHQKADEFDNLGKVDSPDDKEQEGGGVRADRGDNLDAAEDDALNEDSEQGGDRMEEDDDQNEDGPDDEDYHERVGGLVVDEEDEERKRDDDNPIPNPIQDLAQKNGKIPDAYYNDIEEDYGRRMFEKDRQIGYEERRKQHGQNVEEEMKRAINDRDSQRKQVDEQQPMDNEKQVPHRLNEVR